MDNTSYMECREDCPRCDVCPHTNLRRQKLESLIRRVELEKERYEADGLTAMLPPVCWHDLVVEELAK